MGASSGGGASAAPHPFQTLATSYFNLARTYPLDADNRFGIRVNNRISEVHSANPVVTAEAFWRSLRQGGEVIEIDTRYGPGWIARFSDRSHVVWRPVTGSTVKHGIDMPAIDIDIKTRGQGLPTRYRIHFKKGINS